MALMESYTGPQCTIANLKQDYPARAGEIDDMMRAVSAKKLQASKAGLVLRREFEVKFNDDAVRRHCRGMCQCQPS